MFIISKEYIFVLYYELYDRIKNIILIIKSNFHKVVAADEVVNRNRKFRQLLKISTSLVLVHF